MKAFVNMAAQGDLLIIKVNAIPDGYLKASPVDNKYIVAHSETGHHHVIESDEVEYYTNKNDQMKAYLVVKKIIGAALEHLRSFDTHETIKLDKGIYELRRQREYTPAGFRRIED